MELRLPSLTQLQQIYETELIRAFPPAELKPLSSMVRMWREGTYRPLCLYDGEEAVGAAFLWMGRPGWAILDYLCVFENHRNRGLGELILRMLPQTEKDTVIFGEAEAPAHAPDPVMAERRLGFYLRNGLRFGGYDTDIFGIHYRTLYLAEREVEDAELMEAHQYIYQSSFTPENYARYVMIPRDPALPPIPQVPWDQ